MEDPSACLPRVRRMCRSRSRSRSGGTWAGQAWGWKRTGAGAGAKAMGCKGQGASLSAARSARRSRCCNRLPFTLLHRHGPGLGRPNSRSVRRCSIDPTLPAASPDASHGTWTRMAQRRTRDVGRGRGVDRGSAVGPWLYTLGLRLPALIWSGCGNWSRHLGQLIGREPQSGLQSGPSLADWM